MNNRKYATALALMPLVATATTDFIPHAQVRYEDNSNLFAVNEDSPFRDASGNLHLDDRYVAYGAGLDINHLWRQNRAYVTSDYRRFNYQDFTQLDHNEYSLVGGTELTVTRRLTAGATAKYEQQQVPFTEVGIIADSTVQPSYTRINHLYGVSAGYLLTPYWQLNANLNYGLTTLPGYSVKETPWHTDIKYLGLGKFTSRLVVEGDSGKYEGDAITGGQPKFHQTQVQVAADYKLGGRTAISGAVGKSSRSQAGFKISATTGAFSFSQQLTAKTNYYVQYTRTVSGYLTTRGAQLDQTVQGGLNWVPRPRLTLTANYAYSKSTVQGEFANNPDPNAPLDTRNDQTHSYGGSMSYEIMPWLKLSPYYRHQQRSSTLQYFNFTGNLYGAELTARFQ